MKLGRSTLSVVTVVAITSVVGLVREMTVAHVFGTSAEADVFFFSFNLVVRLPQFLLPAASAAVIPVYLRLRERGSRTELEGFVGTVTTLVLGTMAAITALTVALAPQIVRVAGSGFEHDLRLQAISMIQLLSPTIAFLGTLGVLKAILEAEGKFAASQAQQAILSLGMIIAIVTLGPALGIFSLTVGILAANCLQIAWTLYWLRRARVRLRMRWEVRQPAIRRFVALLLPGVAAASVLWLIPVIDVALATRLAEGSVSALSFANRPIDLVARVGIHSLAVVGLPILSWRAVNLSRAAMSDTFERYMAVAAFVLAPSSVLLYFLRVPVIRLLFERGEFTSEATANTSAVFGVLALGLLPMSVAILASTTFNALEDTRTPAIWGSGGNLVVKGLTAPVLASSFGIVGLAASTSLVYLASSFILLWRISRKGIGVDVSRLLGRLVRIVALSVASSVPALLVIRTGLPDAPMILLAGLTMVVTHVGLSRVFNLSELQSVRAFASSEWERLRNRPRREP